VNAILSDPDFMDFFDLIRRKEVVDSFGRTSTVDKKYYRIQGVVLPASKSKDNDLDRMPNYQSTKRNIEVITSFRIYNQTKGYQPDIILWNDTQYIVNRLYSYNHYGPGFLIVECDSMERVDDAYEKDFIQNTDLQQFSSLVGALCN
jgi:hypothetical protein